MRAVAAVHLAREADDYTRDKTDHQDAVLMGKSISRLDCYLPEPREDWARLRHLEQPIQLATAAADSATRPVRASATTTAISPAVATVSPTHRPLPLRVAAAICSAGSPNIMLAGTLLGGGHRVLPIGWGAGLGRGGRCGR